VAREAVGKEETGEAGRRAKHGVVVRGDSLEAGPAPAEIDTRVGDGRKALYQRTRDALPERWAGGKSAT